MRFFKKTIAKIKCDVISKENAAFESNNEEGVEAMHLLLRVESKLPSSYFLDKVIIIKER